MEAGRDVEALEALFALADEEDEAWDFEWRLPARGRAVRFENPTTARDALRGAARCQRGRRWPMRTARCDDQLAARPVACTLRAQCH